MDNLYFANSRIHIGAGVHHHPRQTIGNKLAMKRHDIRFLPLLILVMLINILSQTPHETGHHMVYQLMGHEPV
ncbi:MAG: hypothetical protein GY805_05615 [Chloroflexi bacterium]|nr:hypothetical protein [Chloroflexota bacterium]